MAEEVRAVYLLPPCVSHPTADSQAALHVATNLPLPTKQGQSSYPHCHSKSWAVASTSLPAPSACVCFQCFPLLPFSQPALYHCPPFHSAERKRVRVAYLEVVQLLPRSEGLSLCHPPRNETAGRFYGICRLRCQDRACGRQTPLG